MLSLGDEQTPKRLRCSCINKPPIPLFDVPFVSLTVCLSCVMHSNRSSVVRVSVSTHLSSGVVGLFVLGTSCLPLLCFYVLVGVSGLVISG